MAKKICSREGCKKSVPKGRRAWCSDDCRELARRAAVETAEPQTVSVPALLAELEQAREELDLYRRVKETKSPKWLSPRKGNGKEHHGTLVAFLSDTHFGEVVDSREMNDYNKYNLAIAEQRLRRFFENTIMLARHYLAGVKYDGIVLVHGGDIVSGDIHEELSQTNEISTLETVEWIIPRLVSGIEMWAEEFGRVHNVSVPGNHGRKDKQKVHKRRTASNADTHIGRLLAGQLSKEEGITFDVPHSIDAEFDVYGYRFSVEHGDQARGGDGQVGALGPAKRLALRKQTQMAEEGHPFDWLLLGHFHQLIFGQNQGFVMNGSLKGYDEYARAWHFKPERAQQALLLVSPEHGISMSAPIICQNRDKEKW